MATGSPRATGMTGPRAKQKEKNDLLEELMLLPENAVVRRINELVKRARSVKVHAYIIHYLRKQMPYMMGKQEKQVRSSEVLLMPDGFVQREGF